MAAGTASPTTGTAARRRFAISDAWPALRDKLLSNARFQAFSARFPLTRPIAARRAQAVFDLCAGFVYSQILFACVKLGLLETLRAGPATVAELAGQMRLGEEATGRLLAAARALGLVERRSGGRFGLGPHGAALLGNPGALAMIEHHHLLYGDLSDPVALLRGEAPPTALSRYWAYATEGEPAKLDGESVAAYSDLMSASQPLVSADILDAYPFARHRRLLDVGGGQGTFLAAVAARAPGLALSLFDLPAVIERARIRLGEQGLSERVSLHGGSFTSDPLPEGADLVSLIRVAHDHGDEVVMPLLGKIHAALAPGGTLLVGEPMAETAGAGAVGDAYFGFYLLAMGSGRARSPQRLVAMLSQAGFDPVDIVRTRRPMLTGLIVARKSGA